MSDDTTTEDAGTESTEPEAPATTTDSAPDVAAEAAKWKALARKHEATAKANKTAADELAALKAANQTDTEKAVTEAEQRGRSAATADFGQRLAAAEIKAALTGVVPDPAAIVEDLNLVKYVTDTGDVDQDAVTALRVKYAAFAATKPTSPDLKQGQQGGDGAKPSQLSQADLERMTTDQIVAAKKEGRFNDLLGIKN